MENIPVPKPRTTIEGEHVKRPVPLPRWKERGDGGNRPQSQAEENPSNSSPITPREIPSTSTSVENIDDSASVKSEGKSSVASLLISDDPVSPINSQQSYSNVALLPSTDVKNLTPSSSSPRHPKKSPVISQVNSPSSERSPCTSAYINYKKKYDSLNQRNDVYDCPKPGIPLRTDSWLLYDTISNASSGSASIGYDTFPPATINDNNLPESNILKPVNLLAYENWNVSKEKLATTKTGFSPTVCEFDPLANAKIDENDYNRDLSLLQAFLNGDTYGNSEIAQSATIPNTLAYETEADKSDYGFYLENTSFFLSPPTPPERFDSLSFTDKQEEVPKEKSIPEVMPKKTQWFDHSNIDTTEAPVLRQTSTKLVDRIQSQFNKASRKSVVDKMSTMLKILPESTSYFKKKFDPVYIPDKIITQTACTHQGYLIRVMTRVMEDLFKNFQSRQYILSDQKLSCHSDNESFSTKEVLNMKTLSSIQIILAHNFNYEGELHCFQLFFLNNKINRASVIFGCPSVSDRSTWIQKIVQSICQGFPTKYISDLTRIGWCYIKERVGGTWDPKWLLFRKRSLHYYSTREILSTLDLRKARFVGLQPCEDKKNSPGEGPTLLLDFPDITLYIRMCIGVETRIWHHIIKIAASNNGAWIHHYQLTKADIPTIVDKCINYIYIQGSLSEGIYRRAGSTTTVNALLAAFRKDAWAVQLTDRTCTEHDVASILKRFFRDLPEPILTSNLRDQLCSVSDMTIQEDKVAIYRNLLDLLHPVSKNTLKKLLGHLHFIQLLCEENRMNTSNLASVWGPTLMKCSDSDQANWSVAETRVVYDLIHLYMEIYQPSAADLSRESKMLAVLRKCRRSTMTLPSKPSGELHIWVYVGDKKAENCVNITLKPGKTCGELCIELSPRVKIEAHLLCIEEVICCESMSRPLHHSEVVLDVVLRWGYWDEIDRKDNYLLLKGNQLIRQAALHTIPSEKAFLSMELKFAHEKTRYFKPITFNFCINKISCYKDKECSMLLASWSVKEIRWYIGHETKRNPMCKWSLTFIEKNSNPSRSKDSPWFGCTIAGNSAEDEMKWISALLLSEYAAEILPNPQLAII